MTTSDDSPDRIEAQLILMRADARNATAQAAKAEKESKYYPWIAMAVALIGSGGLIGFATVATSWLNHH